MSAHPEYSPAERDQLAQELLELHFGCHEDPQALQARLAAEPALRALQQEVLQQAKVLEAAVKPTIDPLALPTTPTTTAATQKRGERAPSRWRWLRSPLGRLGAAASLAAAGLLVCYVAAFATEHAHASYCRDHLHLTVTAPRAVPGGAAWSFTAETRNLSGESVDGEIRWRAFNANGLLLAQSSTGTQRGAATVTIPASQGLEAPARLTVTAATATDEVTHVLPLSAAAAGPLVHLTTDRAVYRPGEVVRARAVVLDRITRLPLPNTPLLQARLVDGQGTTIAIDQSPNTADGVGSFALALPAGAGGPHTLEVSASDGSLPTERVDFVVRTFQAPQLQKTVVLDRSSYAPGARGTAAVTALRLAAGRQGASGASAVATLVVDGTEVWREKRVLGALGEATFAFQVPKDVAKGAARFVATIDDGGIVETEVKPFVVPTGRVVVGMFPEGGELVAGVDNRVYVECSDPLGRALDGVGDLLDERDRVIAKFRTAHQGRGTIAFVPKHGVAYRLRLAGQAEPFALPVVQERGVAMQLRGDELAAGAPLRLGLGGRGDGPWLLGVFCRGVLVGQTTLRAGDDGELRADVTLPLLGDASGVLRATLFDRQLQPVAERLFLRASAQRLDIAITPAAAELSPGDKQKLTVRTTDETGRERLAVVGLTVTDDAVNALASEPRIGLVDHARLFADVDPKLERLEAFGDFFLGADGSASHADLLLGTRGWRRFVWRNDAAAQAAITARGPNADAVLTREGFAQTPQVESNLHGATAKASSLAGAAENADERTGAFAWYAFLVLLGLVWLEVVVLLLPRDPRRAVLHATGWAALACAIAILWPQTLGSSLPPGRAASLAEDITRFITDSGPAIPKRRDMPGRAASDFDQEAIQRGVLSNTSTLLRANGAPLPFDLGAGGWDDTIRFRGHLLFDEFDRFSSGLTFPGANPLAGAFFNDGSETDLRGRNENFFYRYIPHQSRQYAHQHTASDDRRDFAPTIYWNTLVVTRDRGTATVEFATSDAATTWRVHADGHTLTESGRLGQASTTFATRLPVQVEAKLPDEVAAGDRLLLPVNVVARDAAATSVPLTVRLGDGLRLGAEAPTQVALQEGRGRALLPIDVLDRPGTTTVQLEVRHGTFQDRVERTLVIAPRGFPHRRDHGGTLAVGTAVNATITIPDASVPGNGRATLRLFPTPLTTLAAGLEGMLQEPHGCFEQTSSTNYPNTLVLQLLQGSGDAVPAAALRARELLAKGYARLVGFECKRGGFEWFGGDPGHEALTAYGLLQFHDMAQVFDVDAAMVARTRSWLLGRRNERGDFVHEGRDHHSFGNSQLLTNAYCTYALLQSGTKADELARELAALAARGKASDDAYELALIANALGLASHADAAALRQRLVALQRADGSLCGTTTSITCSGPRDLAVETTSYAVLAWLQDPAFAASSWRALQFVQTQRQGSGTFGATQATVCALRALIAWANQYRQAATAGTLRVFAGERLLSERAFAADAMEPVRVELWSQLPAGEHTLRLEVATADRQDAAAVPATMPWAIEVAYHAEQPADDPQAPLRLRTQLRRAEAVEGDTVAVDVTVQNPGAQAVPTPIVRLGLPAGCELPTRVLEDLQKAGTFDHWELRGRDLVLYWRTLPARGEQTFVLDLVARVPGTSSGPASRVLPYYTPTAVHWAAPLQLAIAPR